MSHKDKTWVAAVQELCPYLILLALSCKLKLAVPIFSFASSRLSMQAFACDSLCSVSIFSLIIQKKKYF